MQIKNKIYAISFLFYSILVSFFLLGVFFYNVEDNPVKLGFNIKSDFFTFVPQGWAYFTRNPREAQIVLYKRNSKNQLVKISQRHSDLHNLLGLKRNASKLMSELQLIKEHTDRRMYYNTRWNYQEDKYSPIQEKVVTVKNPMQDPILCGEYLIVFQRTVPWAWTDNIEQVKMPAKYITLNIVCDDKPTE